MKEKKKKKEAVALFAACVSVYRTARAKRGPPHLGSSLVFCVHLCSGTQRQEKPSMSKVLRSSVGAARDLCRRQAPIPTISVANVRPFGWSHPSSGMPDVVQSPVMLICMKILIYLSHDPRRLNDRSRPLKVLLATFSPSRLRPHFP